jgi:hypothetical protein
VLTTKGGAKTLHRRLPNNCEVVVLPGTNAVNPGDAVHVLAERGHRFILSEAGHASSDHCWPPASSTNCSSPKPHCSPAVHPTRHA